MKLTASIHLDSIACNDHHDGKDIDLFAVGGYELDTERNRRVGKVDIYQFTPEKGLLPLFSTDKGLPGVLDMQWDHQNHLYSIHSDGLIRKWAWQSSHTHLQHQDVYSYESIGLSLSVAPHKNTILGSYSNGHLVLFDLSTLTPLSTLSAHSFEAWIGYIDPHIDHQCWSGGDDCILSAWDTRSNTRTKKRRFESGVTCLLKSTTHPHSLFVGEYQNQITLLDERMIRKPVCTVDCMGGIWRMKWSKEETPLYMGVAAMRGNFHRLSWKEEEGSAQLLSREVYDAHGGEDLAYGFDWGSRYPSYGCCGSFYDNTLSITNF